MTIPVVVAMVIIMIVVMIMMVVMALVTVTHHGRDRGPRRNHLC